MWCWAVTRDSYRKPLQRTLTVVWRPWWVVLLENLLFQAVGMRVFEETRPAGRVWRWLECQTRTVLEERL